jgi:LmbE family N-acetylglucosaminyl deacetylase
MVLEGPVGVIVAHPDDEILGCGGVMAAYSTSVDFHILILGEGITSRFQQRDASEKEPLELLKGDAQKAADVVGAKSVSFGGMPDNRFDEMALLDVIKKVEHFLETYKPVTIFTHHPGDLNVDHGVTYRSVLTATRPMQGERVKEIYTCEIQSSSEWAFQTIAPAFQPNVFYDITNGMESKIKAMEVYESERRPFPHPRSPESLKAHASRWGCTVGVNFAEAFQLIRSVR